MEQIKPGTRCECLDAACPSSGDDEGCELGCTGEAVRMVTVPMKPGAFTKRTGIRILEDVPMCEACASHHESKVAR